MRVFYLDSFFIRKNNATSFLQNHNRNGCDNAIPQQYEIFHSFPLHMKTIPCKWNRWKCSSPISYNAINTQKFSFNKSESRWHLEQSFQTANWFLLPWERSYFRVISKKEDSLSTTERRRVDREFLSFVALNSLFKLMIYNLWPNFL